VLLDESNFDPLPKNPLHSGITTGRAVGLANLATTRQNGRKDVEVRHGMARRVAKVGLPFSV
jgi:hypothetical protein